MPYLILDLENTLWIWEVEEERTSITLIWFYRHLLLLIDTAKVMQLRPVKYDSTEHWAKTSFQQVLTWYHFLGSKVNRTCTKNFEILSLSNRLSSTIDGNREMNKLYETSQVSNTTRKTKFFTSVDMFINMFIYMFIKSVNRKKKKTKLHFLN